MVNTVNSAIDSTNVLYSHIQIYINLDYINRIEKRNSEIVPAKPEAMAYSLASNISALVCDGIRNHVLQTI